MSRIYFYCYDSNIPSGGIKVLYQHVDILNKYGLNAFILHETPGFRCNWFKNKTPVVSMGDLRLCAEDYLVIPEEIFSKLNKEIRGLRKVVFNQGCYHTFSHGYSLRKKDLSTPYHDKELVAVLVVSEDSRQYINYVFPSLRVFRVHNAINPQIFSYYEHKRPIISFMTRKNETDILQVINILKFRNALGDFGILPIYGQTEKKVAQILRESLIFLSFGRAEGFSLPPAEAMACGCIVIGYHGMGGREFFKPEFSYPVVNGDIITFAKTVEKVIELYRHDKDALKEKGRLASRYILENYSVDLQEKDIVQFWESITKYQPIP
jgi:glycosyltransferase involved in cell wall biosynthesis